jgi:hypothetical protein
MTRRGSESAGGDQDYFIYGFVSGGERRSLLFLKLDDALYSAITDLHQGDAEPLGIRRGRCVLFWRGDLQAVHAQLRRLLAARRDWAVIQALRQLAALRQ